MKETVLIKMRNP